MARCFAYRESQGVGPLELSAKDLQDAAAIARQLAFEMNLTFDLATGNEGRARATVESYWSLVQIWTGICYNHREGAPARQIWC